MVFDSIQTKIQGITLIELLITLMILAGLFTLSLTSLSFLNHKNEREILIHEIKSALHYARIQAINLEQPVFLASRHDDNWASGMILTQHHPSKILYQWHWQHPNWVVRWSGVHAANFISFSNNPLSAISNGRFHIAHASTKEQVILVLNRLGRIRVL